VYCPRCEVFFDVDLVDDDPTPVVPMDPSSWEDDEAPFPLVSRAARSRRSLGADADADAHNDPDLPPVLCVPVALVAAETPIRRDARVRRWVGATVGAIVVGIVAGAYPVARLRAAERVVAVASPALGGPKLQALPSSEHRSEAHPAKLAPHAPAMKGDKNQKPPRRTQDGF
jgi:hypothetical protein